MKSVTLALMVLGLGLASPKPAHATMIYFLNNVILSDGGTADGYYADDWHIDITTSAHDPFGVTYIGNNSGGGSGGMLIAITIGKVPQSLRAIGVTAA